MNAALPTLTQPTPQQVANGEALFRSTARTNLRKALAHEMFTPERRRKAEELMQDADANSLVQWKIKVLAEVEKYEAAS